MLFVDVRSRLFQGKILLFRGNLEKIILKNCVKRSSLEKQDTRQIHWKSVTKDPELKSKTASTIQDNSQKQI